MAIKINGVTVIDDNRVGNLATISQAGNVAVSAGGNANVAVVTGSGLKVTGAIEATSGFIGLDASKIANGTSEMAVIASGGNIRANIGGATVQTIAADGVRTTGIVSATGNITGGNLSGTSISGTLTTAAQTNITSVGTLSSVSVSGNVQGGNLRTAGLISATGSITGASVVGGVMTGTSLSVSGAVTGASLVGTLTTASQTNITAVGTLTSLNSGAISSSGNVTGANLVTGGLITATGNITGGNVSGATITGTSSVVGGGITLNANTISSTGSTLTIDPSAAGASGLVVIAGNLQVQGTTTTIDSTTVTINDLVFTTANNAATASAANGGGIEVGPAGSSYATWTYDQPNSRWTTSLGINATGNITGGNLSGTNIAGTLTTAAQTNITSVGTLSSVSVSGNVQGGNLRTAGLISATGSITGGAITGSSLTVSTGTVTLGNIVNANANGVGNIGSSTTYFNTVFAKATSAQYADLAEMYEADQIIEPGTVVSFGGVKEVTVCVEDGSRRVAGVVSTNPSYIMNAGLTGDNVVAVALTGRVPTKVTGTVRKGDMLVAAGCGRARAEDNPATGQVIGKALADFDGAEGVIEVVVGRL